MQSIPAAVLTAILPLTALAGGTPAPATLAGMDTDRNGTVSADEHAAAARRMFDRMDADADGLVTAVEMTTAHDAITGRKTQPDDLPSAQKIDVIDTDNDGRLSADEHASGARSMFAKMDGNSDGALTQIEFDAGHVALESDGN